MENLAASQEKASQLTEVVKAIAHPMRLRIIALLAGEDQRVINLAQQLAQSPSAVSQQLRILRMSGLVCSRKQQGQVRYALAQPRLRELVHCLEGCQG